MLIIAIIPVIVLIIGLLIWALAANPILKEAGHDMFWTGMLVTLAVMAGHTITIGSR